MKRILIFGCIVALSACTTDREDEPVDIAPEALEQAETAAPPSVLPVDQTDSDSNERERQAKRTWNASPKPKVESIDWRAANGYPHIETSRLPATEQPKIATLPLPVMLPQDDELLQTAIITTGDDWYAVSLKGEGVSLHLRGTRVSYDFDDEVWTAKEKAMGESYTLTRTHQIVTVAFGSFGAAYTVDVECSRPMEDPRCTEDEYALDLANDLAVAGGLR